MKHFIVEYAFDPPLGDDAFNAAFMALKPCLEMRGVRRLRSWFADDRTRAMCEYEAVDAQTVRDAYHAAKVPFARVWSGRIFEFGAPKLGG